MRSSCNTNSTLSCRFYMIGVFLFVLGFFTSWRPVNPTFLESSWNFRQTPNSPMFFFCMWSVHLPPRWILESLWEGQQHLLIKHSFWLICSRSRSFAPTPQHVAHVARSEDGEECEDSCKQSGNLFFDLCCPNILALPQLGCMCHDFFCKHLLRQLWAHPLLNVILELSFVLLPSMFQLLTGHASGRPGVVHTDLHRGNLLSCKASKGLCYGNAIES